MTETGIEGFCKKPGKDIGKINGKGCLHLCITHFCKKWESENVSLLKAKEEVEKNFELN